MTDENALEAALAEALALENEQTSSLSQELFSAEPPDRDWALGPFRRRAGLDFRAAGQWPDATGIGWTSSSLINPSLALDDAGARDAGGGGSDADRLVMAYRASPVKESTSSRIGLARRRGGAWVDSDRAIVWPSLPNETLGCEDPKLYRAEGRWWLFYNGVFRLSEADRAAHPSPGYPLESIGCDINLAVSDDLEQWHKLGPIADRALTRNWAKGAVIPRDDRGRAVRIDGDFLMFVSEGFDGVLHLGRSADLRHWRFEPADYLSLEPLGGGVLHEVACATLTPHGLVLDFFFSAADGTWSAGQSLYDPAHPTRQLDTAHGGTLSWGGLLQVDGRWTFAQGWDAPRGSRELYVYAEEPRPHG